MTLTVSVSDLRDNISSYLRKTTQGTRLLVRDQKRQITIAQIIPTSSFDKHAYEQALNKAAGIFSAHNHPQWRTKTHITAWLTKSRLADQREF